MKQLLTSFIVASAFACLTSSANASLPFEETLSLEAPTLIGDTPNPTDTMLAQCYGGRGYSYGYAPVYRSTRYYYPQRRSGLSISIGGGRGGFYPGYRGFGPGGYGPRYGRYGGFGPGGFGRSGVGLFLNF